MNSIHSLRRSTIQFSEAELVARCPGVFYFVCVAEAGVSTSSSLPVKDFFRGIFFAAAWCLSSKGCLSTAAVLDRQYILSHHRKIRSAATGDTRDGRVHETRPACTVAR
jgi:hypothetical protein